MNTRLKTFLATILTCASVSAFSAGLPAATQAKVDKYKQKLVEWAANPAVVSAVKEANSKGPMPGMTNAKWLDAGDADPSVATHLKSKAGVQLKQWEEDPGVDKLVVRDEKGNLVAASTKPLLYNNAVRPVYINAIKGQVWADNKIVPDPTTQVKSVQASAPVLDGKKVIGVLHLAINE